MTSGVAASKNGLRLPSLPRCRSLCTPMMGFNKIPNTAGRLPLTNPIKVSEAVAQRSCSGTRDVGNCSMIWRHKSPSSIQNMTVIRARDV